MHMSSGRFSEYHSSESVATESGAGHGYASNSSQVVIGPLCSSMYRRPPSCWSSAVSSAAMRLSGMMKPSTPQRT